MKIIKVSNYEEVSKKAFELVKEVVERGHATLGLATGSSPVGLYEEMVKDHKKNKTSYKNIVTFNLDEYIGLDKSHHQSYWHFMHEQLFNHIDINEKNINIPDGKATNLEKECNEYSKKVVNACVDLQILGIGTNGHIAFNEPGSPFEGTTAVVSLTEQTIMDNAKKYFNSDTTEVPKTAISMGIKDIMHAKQIVLIASGKNKAVAVKEMIHGPLDESMPASILQTHSNVIVIIDEDAGYLL